MGRGRKSWIRRAGFAALLIASALAPTQLTIARDAQAPISAVETLLRTAARPGTRFGLVVATEDGRELVAIDPDGRYVPASTTKMFTAAAAFATLAGLDSPDTEGGAAVRLEARAGGPPDVVLEGRGDARLSSAPDCKVDCLAALADAVAAATRRVGDVVGDDRWFSDERWSPGMSWNNIPTASGTAVSALTLDDNLLTATIAPGVPGQPAKIDVPAYFAIQNATTTIAAGQNSLRVDRLPGSKALRLTGKLVSRSAPEALQLGIDDPADWAAWRLKAMLEARGVRVEGKVVARHRPADAPPPAAASPLARLTPAPLAEDIRFTEKESQNLHAELLLRRLGRQGGSGSIASGLDVVRAMLLRAGVEPVQYDLYDGSGMSSYSRISPRATVTFLRWAAAQSWGPRWRETLPIGGVDGTLVSRFRKTPLEGRLTAKTGTLNAASALAGYMVAASGRTLIFAAFAGDMPEGVSAPKAIDAALTAIAAAN